MRTIEQTVYTFSELSDEAKDNARNWWRRTDTGAWCDESRQSIETFFDHFGVTLMDYRVGAYCPVEWATDASNEHFRGRKLREFNRDHMPTGYCLDCALWMTFYDVFKATGDAKRAFKDAMQQGFIDWQNDLEFQDSDEYIDETIEANEYEFFENGEPA